MVTARIENSPEDGAAGPALPGRFRDAFERQGAVPAGRNSWLYQYRAERNLQSAHDRIGSRDSSDVDRQHVRHELPQYAGVRVALGLSLRIGADRIEYHAAHTLVQAPRMVVRPILVRLSCFVSIEEAGDASRSGNGNDDSRACLCGATGAGDGQSGGPLLAADGGASEQHTGRQVRSAGKERGTA